MFPASHLHLPSHSQFLCVNSVKRSLRSLCRLQDYSAQLKQLKAFLALFPPQRKCCFLFLNHCYNRTCLSKAERLRAQVAQKDMFISELLDRIAIVECEVRPHSKTWHVCSVCVKWRGLRLRCCMSLRTVIHWGPERCLHYSPRVAADKITFAVNAISAFCMNRP